RRRLSAYAATRPAGSAPPPTCPWLAAAEPARLRPVPFGCTGRKRCGASTERADVLRDAAVDRDVERAVAGNLEGGAGSVLTELLFAGQTNATRAARDVHALRCASAEVIRARIDEAQGHLGASWQDDAVAHHLAVEIDIGQCMGGDALEGSVAHAAPS